MFVQHRVITLELQKSKQGKPNEGKFSVCQKEKFDLIYYDKHFADNSYVSDFFPSKTDSELWERLSKEFQLIHLELYPHVLRWFLHISSYGQDRLAFPASQVRCGIYSVGCLPIFNISFILTYTFIGCNM